MTLTEDYFYIADPDKFEPSARILISKQVSLGGRGYITCKQNPTKSELINGIYKPRLTLTNRFTGTRKIETTLKIEFSIPKLLYGNNFDEVTDSDFYEIVAILHSRLHDMGILLDEITIIHAPVSTIHPSKNIPLTDGSTPHYYIKKIKEANTSLALDINQTDYRNEGNSFKWHTNSYEIAFYDKIKDLEASKKSDKRALENDNSIQLNIFDMLRKRDQLEILRFEVRLNKRHKIKSLLKTLGINKELTFGNLFDQSISRKILLYYLEEIQRRRPAIIDYKAPSPYSLLSDLVVHNPKLGIKRTLQVFGLKQALDTINPRELRTILGKSSQRSWYRLMADAKTINLPVTINPFQTLEDNLKLFTSTKLIDYKDRMLNNDKYC